MPHRVLRLFVLLLISLTGLLHAQEAYFFTFGQAAASSTPVVGPVGPAGLGASYQYYNEVGRPSDGSLSTTVYEADDNSTATGLSLTTDTGENGAWSDGLAFSAGSNGRSGAMDDPVFESYGRGDNRFTDGGWRIKGLPAGTYDLYYVINGNGNSTPTVDDTSGNPGGIYIGVGNDTDALNGGSITTTGKTFYDYSNWDSSLGTFVPHDGSASSAAWNCITQSVTITGPNQWIEILHTQAGGTANRIGPASLQLVSSNATPPGAPTGLGATPGNGSVALDWDDNAEAGATYSVYRATTSGNYSTALATGLATSDYTDTTAVNFTTYFYVVTATAETLESSNSSEVSATPADPSNQAPAFTTDPFTETNALEGVAYTASIANDASDPENDAMTFSKVSGPAWLSVAAKGDLTGTPSFSDTQTTPNEFVVEVSAAGGSDTATLQITVDVDTQTPPNAPTTLVAGGGNAVVNLTWDANTEGDLDLYRIFRSETSGSFTYGTPFATSATNSYTDTSIVNGTTYYYEVRTLDIHGNESASSSEASATPTEIINRLYSTMTQGAGQADSSTPISLSGPSVIAWGYAAGAYSDGFVNVKSGTVNPNPYTTDPPTPSVSDYGYRFTFTDGTNPVSDGGTPVAANGENNPVQNGQTKTLSFAGMVSSSEIRRLTIYLASEIDYSPSAQVRAEVTTTLTGGSTDRTDFTRGVTFNFDNTARSGDNLFGNAVYTVDFASPTETDLTVDIRIANVSKSPRRFAIAGYKIETLPGPLPPAVPGNLAVPSVNDETINLDWDDVAGGNITYNVYRSTSSGAVSTPYITGLTSSQYFDTSVDNTRPYFYRVTAFDSSSTIESDSSNEVEGFALDPQDLAFTGTLRVFLLAGQSNMRGAANTADLTLPDPASIPVFEMDLFNGVEPTVIDDLHARIFRGVAMGPEISLGLRLNDLLGGNPNKRIVLVKYAEGGTDLNRDWNTWDGLGGDFGRSYNAFKASVQSGMDLLAVKYPNAIGNLQIEGFFWQAGRAGCAWYHPGFEP